ncbi:MAG: DUF2061 domain-containing protein [Candidatus Thorarchaeota archaeon]|jgi:uncharacterized membrane protein
MIKIRTRQRALVKAVTWRVLAVTVTIIIVFLFTGSLEISLGIGGVDVIAKTILYYLHERGWDRVGLVPDE